MSLVDNDTKLYRIQNIILDQESVIDITRYMYYRSDHIVYKMKDGSCLLDAEKDYDFFTYFNAFSYNKWRKYTNIKGVYLVLNIKGNFKLSLFGH